ncbi:N-acetylmuramoyl-L-alanine amidase [Tenacibaculum sp. UWU-22]|uniref:N-acetylmuramoyl-L-alanine amidase family protein n=1 Tax=Tenacibaculum sp. UWU-22 TaxID=3234187 RepID=UPI0034DAC28F
MQFLETYKFNLLTKYFSFLLVFFSLFLHSFTVEAQKQYVVVLDAGHGGHDPGKVGYKGYKEKDVALKITLLVGKLLTANENVKVVYTRKKDVFVDLWKRGDIANNAKADLFVSIHCNAHYSQAHGVETWVLGLNANKKNFEVAKRENSVILLEDNYKEKYEGFDPHSPESVIGLTLMQEENLDKSLSLASIIQQNLTTKLKRTNRGVKQAGFVVLFQTTMPSVLIETGFITNKSEGSYLHSAKGQKAFANSIANSIKEYIHHLQINTVANTAIGNATRSDAVEYKIQIASSKNKLATKSYNFKGLKPVEREQVGKYYKYYYGNTSNYKEIKAFLKKAKEKGYTSAFIVAYKNGKKISVLEASK